jgi:integrase
MAVYDRWHLSRPGPDAVKCKTHRGKHLSAEHGQGKRWQVRAVDEAGGPIRENYEFEDDAKDRDAEVRASVRSGSFIDRRGGQTTFAQYAEDYRTHRTGDRATAERLELALRNHCYDDPANRGLTLKEGVAIGNYPMHTLANRPTLLAKWVGAMPLHPNSVRLVMDLVSPIFEAAVDDKIIGRNPMKSGTVRRQRPSAIKTEVHVWTAEQVDDVAQQLPEDLRALAYLGAACGQRQGELFAQDVTDVDWLRKNIRTDTQVKIVGNETYFASVKNKNARTTPVADYALMVLAEHIRRYPPVSVTLPFLRQDGKVVGTRTRKLMFYRAGAQPWSRHAFNPHWRRAWRAAGIPEAEQANGVHILRHTAVSTWLSGRLSLAMTAEFVGDSQQTILKTYSHFLPNDVELGRDIMNGFFGDRHGGQGALEVPFARAKQA